MSIAATQGAPDWSRQAPWSDQTFINDNVINGPGPFSYTVGYVGNIRALSIFFQTTNKAAQAVFTWYSDQALAHPIDETTFTVGAGQSIRRSFRPMGAFLVAQVVFAGGGTLSYSLVLQSIADIEMPASSGVGLILIAKTNGSVGANATATDQLSASGMGWATWQCFTSGTTWSAQLISKDYQGNASVIAQRFSGVNSVPITVILPGGDLSVNISNADTATRGYTQTVILYPSYS